MIALKSKRKLILLLVFILSLTLITGCSDKGGGDDKESGTDTRDVIVALPTMPSGGFDPYVDGNFYEARMSRQVYDYLVTYGPDGSMIPSAAEEFSVADDGMTYTFLLKQGIKFTNGEELKASDVKFSIGLAMESAFTADAYSSVDSVETPDDYTVLINMKEPSPTFLESLGAGYLYIVNEAAYTEYGDQYGKTPEATVGTGPYVVTEWDPTEKIVFEANPDYFKGVADLKKITVKAITDQNAAIIALQTGDIDIYLDDAIPGIFFETIENDENLTLSTYDSTVINFIAMNNVDGMFTDVEVRKAIAYAVNRDKALMAGMEGGGTIADYPGAAGFRQTLENAPAWYSMDIEAASQIIKDAGLEGKKVTIKTYDLSPSPEITTAVQDDLNKIGLNVSVEVEEFNTFLEDVRTNHNYEIAIAQKGGNTKDVGEHIRYFFLTDSIFNYAGFSDPKMDKFILSDESEMDEATRLDLYTEAIKLFNEKVIMIPLFYTNGTVAHRSDITIDQGLLDFHDGYLLVDYKWAK